MNQIDRHKVYLYEKDRWKIINVWFTGENISHVDLKNNDGKIEICVDVNKIIAETPPPSNKS